MRRSWVKGFIADIRQGGIKDALASQFESAADRLIDKLIDSLLDIDFAALLGDGKGGGSIFDVIFNRGGIAGQGGGVGSGGGNWLGNLFSSLFGGFGKNARGTDWWPGGPSWVGEEGPELVNLPRGAQVIDADRSRRMAATGGGSGGPRKVEVTILSKLEVPSGYVPDGQLATLLRTTHDSAVRTAVSVAEKAAPGQQLAFSIHKG